MLDPNIQLTKKEYFETLYYISNNELKMSIEINIYA